MLERFQSKLLTLMQEMLDNKKKHKNNELLVTFSALFFFHKIN